MAIRITATTTTIPNPSASLNTPYTFRNLSSGRPDGTRTLQLTLYDRAGNTRVASAQVVIDTLKPAGSIAMAFGYRATSSSPKFTRNATETAVLSSTDGDVAYARHDSRGAELREHARIAGLAARAEEPGRGDGGDLLADHEARIALEAPVAPSLEEALVEAADVVDHVADRDQERPFDGLVGEDG